MNRVFAVLSVAFALGVFVAQAADSSTGWISDAQCGAKNSSGSTADRDCVTKCIQSGQKPVFVDSKKDVWSIDNPDTVKNFYGDKVSVKYTADASAKSVHIDSIKAAK